MNNLKNLRGMLDLLPDQTSQWQKIEFVMRKHFKRSSLHEIRTPIIELTDLFARGIGENTDVVGKEMYTFLDKGNRSCTLRPEGTASVVRALIQSGLVNQGPQRLWYQGPMFRYERPQAGRQRQFHQVGVEFFGLSSVTSDAELICIAWDFLEDLGLNNLTLELNTLGNSEDRSNYKDVFVSWLNNNLSGLDDESIKRIKTNPLRILDTKNSQTKLILKSAPSLHDYLSEKSIDRFEKLKDILKSLKIPFKVNEKLVRGLDYYCHTAFEITSDSLGSQSTVCGGGRYDGLVKQLGGPETPAIGWAIGLERLNLLVKENLNCSDDVPSLYFISQDINAIGYSLSISRQLRLSNIFSEIDHSGSSISKQFKRADRSGALWAIVIGEKEIEEKKIMIKSLRANKKSDSTEISFSLFDHSELIKFIKNNTTNKC